MMGGNDAELPAADALIEQFVQGEISREAALAGMLAIKTGKQDYH